MNILYIDQYAGHPRLGMEYRPFFLAHEWARQGHRTLIVAGDFSHLRPRVQPGYHPFDGVDFFFLPTRPYRGNGPGRMANLLSFMQGLERARPALVQGFAPQVVIASSTHPYDGGAAWRIARQAGAPLAWEIHDLWPLTQRLLYGMGKSHPFVLLTQRRENFLLTHADGVVSLLPGGGRYLAERGQPRLPWVWVPNGVPPPSGPPRGHPALARLAQQKQAGRFLFLYAGGMERANALDNLIRAFSLLPAGRFHLALLGDGRLRPQLQALARGNPGIGFYGRLPREELPAALSLADGLVLGTAPSPLYRYGTALNKLGDYLQAGRPVVFCSDAAYNPVQAAGCGLTVPPGDPGALAAALAALAALDSGQRAALGRRGRQWAGRHLQYPVLAARMAGFLQQLSIRSNV